MKSRAEIGWGRAVKRFANVSKPRATSSNYDLPYQSIIISNVNIRVGEIQQFCQLQDEGQSLMRAAMTQLNLSALAYHRTRSVKVLE